MCTGSAVISPGGCTKPSVSKEPGALEGKEGGDQCVPHPETALS